MSVGRVDTNVRIPQSALVALRELCTERGRSRDAVVRDLLDEHVRLQEPLPPEQRLTHVCTMLRHPAQPEHRRQKPGGVLLRLRLDPGMAERARAVSLRLPGQPARRGPAHYQARPLADAVLTAIERARTFTDDVLDGLRPRLVTHDTAKGLWGLVVAASLTDTEEELLSDADPDWPALSHRPARPQMPREVAETVAAALRDQEAWHAPHRYELIDHFARVLLGGPDAEANARMLHEQGRDWEALQHDLRHHTDHHHWLLADAPEMRREVLAGRGSSAVWRARRRVALEDIGVWLRSRDRPGPACEHQVGLSGWTLRMPAGWYSLVLPAGTAPSPAWAAHVKRGRLLELPVGSRRVLWPVLDPPDGGPPRPVPGIEAAFAALAPTTARDPLVVVEAVLARFDDTHATPEQPDVAADPYDSESDPAQDSVALTESEEYDDQPVKVLVPAATAHDLGLIDTPTHDRLTAEARQRVLREMRAALQNIESDPRIRFDDHALDALRSSISPDKVGYFIKILSKAKISFVPTDALWHWPIASVTEAIEQNSDPAAVSWLASWSATELGKLARESRLLAWETGFHRFRRIESPARFPQGDCDIEAYIRRLIDDQAGHHRRSGLGAARRARRFRGPKGR